MLMIIQFILHWIQKGNYVIHLFYKDISSYTYGKSISRNCALTKISRYIYMFISGGDSVWPNQHFEGAYPQDISADNKGLRSR